MIDKKYNAARVKLMAIAEAEANRRVTEHGSAFKLVEGHDGEPFKWSFFTQFFHEEMNRLAVLTKLVRA